MLGLFKKKLNVADHLDIINCLIIEEAEQQWNYHAVENNFDKEAFRGSSFAFGVVEMFVTKILKIKADDKVLMAIVQLGRDRCQEYQAGRRVRRIGRRPFRRSVGGDCLSIR